ncbi:hypothetical protein BpHYR1_016666 [Brachionus plicatilis]|uniref:Uncharacterized protein n=1 Tax=Brachionus plicatilis TaxID=10195 RepID=A0A3M7QC26_BRAPC|nr:hypothetical protein BpHYR1_016666 [Brachionus plicatilis]
MTQIIFYCLNKFILKNVYFNGHKFYLHILSDKYSYKYRKFQRINKYIYDAIDFGSTFMCSSSIDCFLLMNCSTEAVESSIRIYWELRVLIITIITNNKYTYDWPNDANLI